MGSQIAGLNASQIVIAGNAARTSERALAGLQDNYAGEEAYVRTAGEPAVEQAQKAADDEQNRVAEQERKGRWSEELPQEQRQMDRLTSLGVRQHAPAAWVQMDQFATQVDAVQVTRLRVLQAYLVPHAVASEGSVAQELVYCPANRQLLLAQGLKAPIDCCPASSVEPGVAVQKPFGDYFADADKGASCEME